MSAGGHSQEVIASLEATFATNCCVTATLALYVYDRILNLDREVSVVWTHRKTFVTALFASMHFFSFSYLFLGTLLAFYSGPCEVSCIFDYQSSSSDRMDFRCRGYSIYISYVAIAAALYFTFGSIAALRVYAINGRNWRLPIAILALSLLGPATDVVHCVLTYRIAEPPPVGCVIGLSDEDLTDNVLLILNILNATLWLTHVYNNITVFSNVYVLRDFSGETQLQLNTAHRFSIILLSHFFLNLRTAALNPNDSTTEQTSHMSDIRFTSALGNFGSAVAGSSTDDGTERGDELEWFDDDTETYAMSDGRSHSALATGEAGSSLRRKSQHDETSV
ncbi:hypothetical protein EVJ58_g1934 [Rhodofomes roseus]|uniref:DUF6533 domain-containing protein n=1 Tax=Rhodofomes roseus TaxID=34475 RepID=A0A4Y9YWK7_9APHY|nr:hypothetical protein EVJ58_g1934 [Rhodofomes roseus]